LIGKLTSGGLHRCGDLTAAHDDQVALTRKTRLFHSNPNQEQPADLDGAEIG